MAVRSDPVALRAHHGRPWLMFEGEPVPLVDGAFTRLPQGSKGMLECWASEAWSCLTAGFAGDLEDPRGLWVTVQEQFERVGDAHRVYHLAGDAWREETLRDGVLVGHYAPLLERGGAVIGLQHWSPDPVLEIRHREPKEDRAEQAKDQAHHARVKKALRRAKAGFFAHVAGPAEPLPVVPEGLWLRKAATTPDGTLVAVASSLERDAQSADTQLLVWPPGSVEATPVAVPDLEHVKNAALWVGDGWTMVTGCVWLGSCDDAECADPYLAITEGGPWQRIPIVVPGRSPNTTEIVGATRSPDGALWLALGNAWVEDDDNAVEDPLWIRPAGGSWQAVPLPPIEHSTIMSPKDGKPR
ncbi:MAG: hypothetical protein KDK70_08270, partial [Myxococcales bacterium]|nr:hypothetical protein [Myxococcales bacterium]